MTAYDDNIYQMKSINSEYRSFDNSPKNELEKNPDTPNPNNNIINTKYDNEIIEEKPYYEQSIEIQQPISENKRNIFSKIKDYINNLDSNNKLLFYSLLFLLIQIVIIFIFALLGFSLGISEIFVKHPLANLIPTTVITFLMSITCYCVLISRNRVLTYIYIILYIPCITLYCFALSGIMNKNNVICGLVLYVLDILSFIIAILIFDYGLKMLILFGIISGVISIVILIIFHYKLIKKGLITFKISTVGLSEIIYLIIISIYVVKRLDDYDYIYATMAFNLGKFVIFIIAVLMLIIGYLSQ